MPITFYCPNGHKLNCRDERAGRPGKCPKCGADFTVPPRTELDDEGAEPLSFDFSQLDAPQRSPSSAPAPNPPARESADRTPPASPTGPAVQEEIEFLCPNGHVLHGPTSLVGRPGKCPHCSARFLVPSPDDVPDLPAGPLATAEEAGIRIQIDTSGSRVRLPGRSGVHGGEPTAGPAPAAPVGAHPVAQLFLRLWEYKLKQGATVELHLGDGKLVVPESYAAALANQSHAVFVEKEANGRFRLTAISWSAIERIAVRGIDSLDGAAGP